MNPIIAFNLCNGGQIRAHAAACPFKSVAGDAALRMKKLLTAIISAACKRTKENDPAAYTPEVFFFKPYHYRAFYRTIMVVARKEMCRHVLEPDQAE